MLEGKVPNKYRNSTASGALNTFRARKKMPLLRFLVIRKARHSGPERSGTVPVYNIPQH